MILILNTQQVNSTSIQQATFKILETLSYNVFRTFLLLKYT